MKLFDIILFLQSKVILCIYFIQTVYFKNTSITPNMNQFNILVFKLIYKYTFFISNFFT